ncbi:hypothetical protein [Methylobacterium sp. CCH5-D2]|uniref:hypothetical protein n=1 Tax=Methylobacterium sp. CCH5-D2 TaxID=1768765 RepID=UPI0012E33321|nr:hypothetical protein [Methylobacterium sp. CCH5-D2]
MITGLLLLTSSFAAAAEDQYDRDLPYLFSCVNKNLGDLIPSGEPIKTINEAVLEICESEFDRALNEMTRAALKDPERPPHLTERQVYAFFNEKMRKMLLAYAIKFKATGGPTSLSR